MITIRQIEVLDRVNYFGLVESKQIMFCTSASREQFIYIWCKSNKAIHALSPTGKIYDNAKINLFNNNSKYIVEVDCIQLRSNDLKMWIELYNQGLFPFWEPQNGPFKFNDKTPQKIALCKVYETNYLLKPSDFDLKHGFAHRLLYRKREFKLRNDMVSNWINSDIYENHENRINEILKKYKQF